MGYGRSRAVKIVRERTAHRTVVYRIIDEEIVQLVYRKNNEKFVQRVVSEFHGADLKERDTMIEAMWEALLNSAYEIRKGDFASWQGAIERSEPIPLTILDIVEMATTKEFWGGCRLHYSIWKFDSDTHCVIGKERSGMYDQNAVLPFFEKREIRDALRTGIF